MTLFSPIWEAIAFSSLGFGFPQHRRPPSL
jgi:hypothetical protein